MASLSDLISAIETRLKALPLVDTAAVEVLVEDPVELEAKINQALAEIGRLILIGQPRWSNTTPTLQVANMEVTIEIAIGENPVTGREDWTPHCLDLAQAITENLQAYKYPGFTALSVTAGIPVPDKARQIYTLNLTTKWIVHPTQV